MALVLLFISLLLLTQTSFFREKVKIQVVKLVEEQLKMDFEIEAIEGNFYNNLILKEVKLADADSLLASFGSLKINYELIPLLKKTIYIDSVILVNPQINLWQKADSSWNFNTIVASDDETPAKKSKSFPFEISVEHAAIKDGEINISSFTDIVPAKLADINLVAGASFCKNETAIRLNSFDLRAQNPAIELKKFSGICKMNQKGIQVDSLLFVAGNSTIDFHGKYQSPENLAGKIDSAKINKNDLSIFVPSFKLLCSPGFKVDFVALNDSVSAHVQLNHNEQLLAAEISFESLTNLQSSDKKVPYFAQINFDKFRVNDWIETGSQKGLVNGSLEINGENLTDFNARAQIKGEFENSEYNDLTLDSILLNGIYTGDSIEADISLCSDFGAFWVDGKLINSEIPEYKVRVDLENLELTKFVPELLRTTLNGRVEAEGKGFNPEDFVTEASVNLVGSSVYQIPIDSLDAQLTLKKNNLDIDSIILFAPGAFVSGRGQLNFDSLYLNSSVYGDITSLQMIDSFVDLPVAFKTASTSATIKGPVAALEIVGDVDLFNADAYSLKGDSLQGIYNVAIKGDSTTVDLDAAVFGVKTGSVDVDTVFVDFGYTTDFMDIAADVRWKDVLQARLGSRISIGDTLSVDVSDFEMNTVLANFYLPDTLRARLYNNEKLEIENLILKDRKRDDFVFSANGNISINDTCNFHVEANQFDLSQLNRFLDEQNPLKGYLKSDISIGGVSAKPLINGQIEIKDPGFGPYVVSSMKSNFSYKDENGFVELSIPDMGDSFYASISAPLKISLDSSNFVFDPPKEYNGLLVFDSFDVSEIFSSFTPGDSISGLLNGKIEAKGEIQKPLVCGNLDFTDGYYYNEDLGIDYNDIAASLSFDGNSVDIDTFLVRQKNGMISVYGELDFDSTLVKGEITSSSLQVDANKFLLTKHRNYEIVLDANTFIKSKNQSPEFGGKVKVVRSDLYLPALMSESQSDVENDVPLLVQAIQTPKDSTEQIPGEKSPKKAKEKQSYAFVDQLTGRLEVEIPRNTWIKSDDMRIELSGELEIAKSGPYFELFGNIEVIRGQYILYGRKLNINESEIIFQGGEEMDPTLNIEAEYVFRGSDKVKRYLTLNVTGELSEPEITFLLDGTEISETDGVSVLIFGATSDEIGYGGQNGLLNSIGSNALTSLISSQLSRTIGSQLNLDMIEVTTTENWQSAAFVVGKYITNDIFVIYQRGFGEESGDEITPETVTIEYEINDKLFLRLQSGNSKDSGVDIILKFEEENDK